MNSKKKTGQTYSITFPIEVVVTCFLGGRSGEIHAFETSSSGLRKQSGGTLFDSEGRIVAK